MTIPYFEIGPLFRDSRIHLGETLESAAAKMGVTASEVAAWEDGRLLPPLAIRDRLAKHFETDLAHVLEPSPSLELRTVTDVAEANAAWGANCGPVALAAALGRDTVESVREAFSPFRGHTTITSMKSAIEQAGARIVEQWTWPDKRALLLPADGARLVVMLQWGGPWDKIPRAAARYRHMIAYARGYVGHSGPGWVGDCQVAETWSPLRWWSARIPVEGVPKRGDGKCHITWAARVEDRP